MPAQIHGYDLLEKLYESSRTVVYRAHNREKDRREVLKLLNELHPSPHALTRYRHEFEITRSLDTEGVIKVYRLEKRLHGTMLVFEDIGGESFADTLERRHFELSEFFDIAIELAGILGEVHARGVIHKDINPSNIIWNPETGQVKLIDFGISTSLSQEWPGGHDAAESIGTLAYMSPEQTGRTSRRLDYRTDFYSLGATFYELLSGRRACEGDDELALFHCHLAHQPRPVHELRPDVPRMLSKVISKLMAKPAEERYQSAHGLRCDLERCRDQRRADKSVAAFELGEDDVRATLQVSQKLYGRRAELDRLLATFERTCRSGNSLVLIRGSAGVGKSALVRELQRPIIARRARFVAAKFDLHRADVPYSAFADAIGQLVAMLLALPEAAVDAWRERVRQALESNGALLIDIVPQLETLVGPQPERPVTSPGKARHRLSRVARKFIALFCEPHTPLTLFFDDLQWADAASLELLSALLADPQLEHLLVVGAYRGDAVGEAHPLDAMVEALHEDNFDIDEIELAPLGPGQVRALVADTLQTSTEAVADLARLIHDKTSGNPYFVNRFIEDLDARQLLWFDAPNGRWCWDLEAIEARELTDNVIELLIGRLRELPEPSQRTLQMAALLGMTFQLDELAAVCEISTVEAHEYLAAAMQAGVVMARSRPELRDRADGEAAVVIPTLAFAHDRVQEAAEQLIPVEDRPRAHLRVGRHLSARLTSDADALLFDVVAHLNEGRSLIDDASERLELARLNTCAARRAMKSLAFASATRFLGAARELLPDDIWQIDPELAAETLRLLGEAESARGHFQRAEELFDEALTRLDEPVERADIYTLLVRQYANQARFDDGLEAATKGLSELGIEFSTTDLDLRLGEQFSQVSQRLAGESIDQLLEVSSVDHPVYDAALRLLGALQPAAGLMDQRLLLLAGLKAVELSLDIGPRPGTVLGLAVYGIALIGFGQFAEANKAGALSLELAAKFDDDFTLAHAGLLHGAMIAHWKQPLDDSIAILRRAQQAGVRSGNLQFAGYALANRLYQQFCNGKRLGDLVEPLEDALKFARQTNNRVVLDQCLTTLRLVHQLRGEDDQAFVDGERDEWAADIMASFRDYADEAVLVSVTGARGILHYLYERSARALEDLAFVEEHQAALLNTIDVSRCTFYRAMAHAECARSADGDEAANHRKAFQENRRRVEVWAQACPENYAHQKTLLDAENAWLDGQLFEAVDLYDTAVEQSRSREFLEIEALACERAAKLWLSRDKRRLARLYLHDARYAYELWGADSKVEHLDENYRDLLGEPVERAATATQTGATTSGTGAQIDVTSVFHASELIARHIEVDELLTTLMQVTIANAGAQHGAFFLRQNTRMMLAVDGEVDQSPRLVEPPRPLSGWKRGARSIVRFVARTRAPVVLERASADRRFQNDRYVADNQVRSVMCVPVEEAGELRGVLYLENNLTADAFTEDRVRVLKILAGHIATSLSKAQLYETVRQEKERFRQLAEHIHEVFWLMDWPERQIVYVSPAYSSTWGRPLPKTPVSLDDWFDAVVPEDREHIDRAIDEDLEFGEYDIIYEIERPSGARRWIRDRGFPIRRDSGEPYRIAGVAEDITRQHEVERMKDEFISVVSHELRTPLTPIKGIFDILARNETLAEDPAADKMIALGLRNSQRLLKLIDDLLDIQKLSLANINFDNAKIDLAAVVAEALQINAHLGESKNIEFVLDVVTSDLKVDADRERLMQVLTNLLSNAVKFSPPSDIVEVSVTRTGDFGRVAVSDYGSGIPEEARERVFEKFVQADSSLTRKHGGAGLGLAISQAIVERLGGKIYFESEVDKGTTFFVELPLVA